MCNARFMEALSSYWNPWKCKMKLLVLFLLDGTSRNAWIIWTWSRSLPSVQASHNENPLLHSAQKKFSESWLKPRCQLAGKLQKCTDLFFFFAFFSAGSADARDVPLHHRGTIEQRQPPWAPQGKEEERCDCVPESRICPSFHGKLQDVHFSTSHIDTLAKRIHKCACSL